MRKIKQALRYLSLMTLLWGASSNAAEIAIVIDDIGYKQTDRKLLELNGQLTYAVLPHTPLGFEYAQVASAKNRDVIIHVPMQATSNNRLLGPGALTHKMSKQEYQQTLLSAMEDIPFAIGMNNHMGSLLTRMEQPMEWTMELLQQHNMFFLDSKTTTYSKIGQIAHRYGVDSLDRNVFLDHDRNPAAIRKQFARLIKLAQRRGRAIAIGHPYEETYQVLQQQLAALPEMGINLVPLSKMLPQTAPAVSPKHAIVTQSIDVTKPDTSSKLAEAGASE